MFANNKGTDQPGHRHNLISAFFIHLLEITLSKLATSKFSIFKLVSVAEKNLFKSCYVESPKDRFCGFKVHLIYLPRPNENSFLFSPIQSQTNDNSIQFESSRSDSTFANSTQTEFESLNLHENVNVHADDNSSMMAQPLNLNLTAKGFKIGHLNIQGLQNKFDQVQLMLTTLTMIFIFLV